ncbi:MAG: ABC transporter ATP-binding protein [Polyangiaceae bacterium]
MHAAMLEGAGKVYGNGVTTRALAPTTVTIEEAEVTVLLGPSGSGKTTLLNLLGGLDKPSEGSVVVEGKRIDGLDAGELSAFRREHVGFVFQFFNLVPTLTARENVYVAAELSGGSPADADTWLERVGLRGYEDRFPSEMSGGQQQRVAIARALAKKPKLLLADEPTGALDHETGEKVVALLEEVAAKEGCAVVVVTHDEDMAKHAARVIRLRDGAIVSDTRRAES